MAEQKSIDEKEKKIIEFWKKNKVFEKSLEKTKNGKPYVFYDGPPFATGLPHHGHLLASTLKDVFPRFFTMKGRYVKRVWGWDCHGLPIENIVEEKLEINSKDEIEKMGVKKFNDTCRSQVLMFASEWKKYVDRIGRWVDFDLGYKTMDTSYIESVWWAFKQLYEKGFLYQGEKILMYCPRCSTPLAKSEIAMDNSYKTIKDISVVVKLKLDGYENTYALAWTTTPWTLPSNLALAVHPDIRYIFVKDKSDGNTYVLARELLGKFYKSENEYEILKEVFGRELENQVYEPPFPYFENVENAFKFVLGDFVTAKDGTGIVHTAPAFGEDDNAVCRKYGIPMVQPVDERGYFTSEVTDYAGKYIHDTNEEIVKDLKSSGKLVMSKKVSHEYPFCYRCDTKLMYRALPAWFVDIQKIKQRLLTLNQNINWIPEHLKDGRVAHNITNAPDWNITRNRYWATAIPVWKNKSGDIKVIGSIEELKKYAKSLPSKKIDLHKDFLDRVELEVNGTTYKRIPEVLDCWFESGSMPFAQFHYPFENKEFFEKNFPADFVVEYVNQTRTWFYYMIVLSVILFDKIPFQNVLTTGSLLAENGDKLSKSKRNFTDPMELIEKFGADTFRFYLLQSSVSLGEDSNISDKIIEEVYKKVILLLYNVSNFYDLYKDIKDAKSSSENILDQWIVSRTNQLISEVTDCLNSYNTVKACNDLRAFIDDLSTWYVRESRDRFNQEDSFAKSTLKYVLDSLSKVMAPIMPFSSEIIYQTINGNDSSVHLQEWPSPEQRLIDEALNHNMSLVREIVSRGLNVRDREGISIKWPLLKASIISGDLGLGKDLQEIIKNQLNVKNLEFRESTESSSDLEVDLDTNITFELESEGLAREITRKIQAARKDFGLVKNERIFLEISSEFNDKILPHEEMIKEKVGAGRISFEDSAQKFDYSSSGKIKGKGFEIKFNKL